MFFWHIVPSWHQIEDQVRQEMGYQGGARFRNHWGEPAASLSLNIRRVESVRSAFYQAEWQAADLLRRRFADLEISIIIDDLIDVVTQMAMIVAGSTLTGAAIGAGVGAFFGGAGAVPMGAAGAALGLQVSSWILAVLGLQSIAEFFVEGLPRVGGYYLTGIHTAWEGPRGEEGLTPFSQDDPYAVSSAAHNIALGHVEVVVLLLGAIVEYLTRGRGNAGRLAQEMGASPKGANVGQWMLKHEDALKSRPDLQTAEPHKGAMGPQHPQESSSSPSTDAKPPRRLKPRLTYENPSNLIPTQTKSEMSGSQIKRLAKSMEKNGFDPSYPVDAWRNPSTGRLEIQDGHHRAQAAIKAGIEKIPVEVWE